MLARRKRLLQYVGNAGAAMGGWKLPGFDIDMDFSRGLYFGKIPSDLTCTRASPRWVRDRSGLWTKLGNNVLPLTDLTLAVWEGRTNIVLQNRDLTDAAWVKTSCTAAKDIAGVDGVAGSASRITTTGSVNSILQPITSASALRACTAFVKRIVGAFPVSMTMDGGTTWTDISSQINASTWSRITLPAQTIANPSVGFKVGANAQQIGVDLVGLENAEVPGPPIDTLAAPVSHSADLVSINLPFGATYSLFGKGTPTAPNPSLTAQNLLQADAGGDAQRLVMRRSVSAGFLFALVGGTGMNLGPTGPFLSGLQIKAAVAIAPGDCAASMNGAAVLTSTPASLPTTPTRLNIGMNGSNSELWNGDVDRAAAALSTRIGNAALVAL